MISNTIKMTTRKELYEIMKTLKKENKISGSISRMTIEEMRKIVEEHTTPNLPTTPAPKGHFVNGVFYPYPDIKAPAPPTLKKLYTTDMFIDFYDILKKYKIFKNSFGVIYDKTKLNITIGMKYHTKKDSLYNDIVNILKKYNIFNMKYYDYFQVNARNGFINFHCDGMVYNKEIEF